MKKYIIFGILLAVAGLLYGVIDFAKAKKEKESLISYNRDIRPILSDKCFSCHGPDVSKIKAGLRLDLPASAFAELEKNKGHFAIVPGNPDKSELIKRISSNDPGIMMPGSLDEILFINSLLSGLPGTIAKCPLFFSSSAKALAGKSNRSPAFILDTSGP